MIWRDHVLNFGSKSATRVTKFWKKTGEALAETVFFSKFWHPRKIPYFWYKRTPLNMKYFRALCWVRRSHWAPLFNWERTVPGSKRVAKKFQIFPNLVVCSLTFCKGFYSLWSLFWYSVFMEQQGKKYCQFLARFRYFANLGQKEKKKLLVCQN